jgi:hypothetical protein
VIAIGMFYIFAPQFQDMNKIALIFSLPFLAENILTTIVFTMIAPLTIYSQSSTENQSGEGRTFMPTIQMGYVAHGSTELSGGLMTQTSVEYRDVSNLILRLNFDSFNSNMNLKYAINPNTSFTGRTSFSELIVGIAYRQQLGKHNLIGYIRPGIRFYGYPIFNVNGNQTNLDYDSRNIGVMRYSIGYEYEILPKLFLTIEGIASHVLKPKDFWIDNGWLYGVTLGVSTPLF